MTDSYPIRPIAEDEYPVFYAVLENAFNGGEPTEAELAHEIETVEFDRTLAAFDGTEMVGTAAAYTFQMAVPGAVAPVAGVTMVGVLPSHRRRGILTSLMHRQLAEIRDRGEAVAALYASEPGIYGRYGYGVASAHIRVTIRRGEGVIVTPADPAGTAGGGRPAATPWLRAAAPTSARAELAKVYDAVLSWRPGVIARDERWWNARLWDPEQRRDGGSPLRCVIAEDDGGPRGYALYSTKGNWDEGGIPAGVLQVRELMAADPRAYALLWADLLNRDLIGEVHGRVRPADDPLLYLLTDSRRARAQLSDGLWVRLIDVPRALTQRRYACPVDAVIEVADDLLESNSGRWRLRAGGREAPELVSCEPTTAPADVSLPVRVLGACYLGGTRLGALAAAGLAAEHRPGTLAALSAALSWDPAPFCPTMF
jgi:predicted acetyltransferase